MASALRQYAFVNAKLRARISEMLDQTVFDEMIRARDLEDAIGRLRDTQYAVVGNVYSRTGDLKMCELQLYEDEMTLHGELERYVSGAALEFTRTLGMRYEIYNLKNALRLWFERAIRGRDIDQKIGYVSRRNLYHEIPFDRVINARSLDDVADALDETPYAEPIRERSAAVAETGSLFTLESSLDRYFFSTLMEQAGRMSRRDANVAKRIVGVEVDLHNINWLVRLQSYYDIPPEEAAGYLIPHGYAIGKDELESSTRSGGDTKGLIELVGKRYSELGTFLQRGSGELNERLRAIEQVLHEILMHEVRRVLGGYPFTVGIILCYSVLKQYELRTLITILNGKYYNLGEERLKRVL